MGAVDICLVKRTQLFLYVAFRSLNFVSFKHKENDDGQHNSGDCGVDQGVNLTASDSLCFSQSTN